MRALVLTLAVAACGGGGGDPPRFDASPPDSDPTCGEWTVAFSVASGLTLLEPSSATPIPTGRTIRVAYDVELDACEQPGMVLYEAGLDVAVWSVGPTALRQIGGTCTGTDRTVRRVAEFQPPSAGTWSIMLGATSESIAVEVGAAPDPVCDQTRTPCVVDCDCDTAIGERCLAVDLGGPTTVCARPCEVDRDCNGAGRCSGDAPGGVPFTCTTDPECDATHACPDGWSCTAGACSPDFTLSQTTRHACSCDADCDPGLRCVRPNDASQPNRCQAMCPTDGPWCEGPHVCGAANDDISGLAGTDAVCGWIGD